MGPLPPAALRWLTCVVAGLALLLVATPAVAHPLGLPATARIVRTAPGEVVVRWAAQPDDVAALAVQAGLRDGPVSADASLTAAEDERLAASEELRTTVLEEVAVTLPDGTACDARLQQQPTVVTHGLEVVFACPAAAEQVTVRLGLLHDLDPRYRTLAEATSPDGETQVMFTGEQPSHTFSLRTVAIGEEPPPGTGRGVVVGVSTDDTAGLPGLGAGWFDGAFLTAIDRPAGVAAWLLGLLVALGVGAVHALAPGHGKAIAAAWLIGDHARRRDAVVLGSTVALMHTGSVLLLGFALFSTNLAPDAARLGASLEAAAGATFLALGGWLVWRRWRDRPTHAGQVHDHPHDDDHGDGHDHAPRRDRDRADESRLQRVVALGAAGGLLPSPSALLVLLTALAIGRLGYGLALVGAFSLGLAATLVGVGLAVLSGRDVAARRLPARFHDWLHRAPLLGAGAVVVLGGAVLVRALVRLV